MGALDRRGATPSTALLTDHYELTALAAARDSGVADRRAVFELFARRLPAARGFGVVAGTARLVEALCDFEFRAGELEWLVGAGVIDGALAEHLSGWRFRGEIDGYAEGELWFPHSPVLTVEATFGDAVILETLALSIMNHDSAVAAAGARMHAAAAGRFLIEGGSRRTHEAAAVAAARAAHLAGFDVTSNLEAGRRYGVPTGGTTMHAFMLAHDSERAACRAQVERFGCDSTFLVDTFGTLAGVLTAVEVCSSFGGVPGAVRLDSGDPATLSVQVRELLDAHGATATKIIVSGDLDEFEIDRLVTAGAPIDRFLAGTRLVTGSGHPTAEFVYKLVAIADASGGLRPVAKSAIGKVSVGGRKRAWRLLDESGYAAEEHLVIRSSTAATLPGGDVDRGRSLQRRFVEAGEPVDAPTLTESRVHHLAARSELRPEHRSVAAVGPALDATPAAYHGATID